MSHPAWENQLVGYSVIVLSARGIIGFLDDVLGFIKRLRRRGA